MSRDGPRHIAPLSPPPTLLVAPKELPWEDASLCAEHRVEGWTYGEGFMVGDASAPLFPPVRDDSGFEEFDPPSKQGGGRKLDGIVNLIEPTSVWSPHSPLSMDEGLPLVDLPPLHRLLSSSPPLHRGNGDADGLVSPISPSDEDSPSDGWTARSEMDWSPSPTFVETFSPPSSPKPHCPSLYDLDSSLGFHPNGSEHYIPVQPPHLAEEHSPFFSFHGLPLALPADLDTDYPDTVMPSDDDDSTVLPPSSPHRRPLNDLYEAMPPFGDVCPTPVPRSPHRSPFSLHDFDEPPNSPHSPHPSLPEIEGFFPEHPDVVVDTISPSLLGGAPDLEDSLRLDLRPLSDPPYMRSPSPDEDDLGFLDLQFDPESAQVETEEFLRLRALRKSALALERTARASEADLNDRITALASSLLPPPHDHDHDHHDHDHQTEGAPDPDAMQTDDEPTPAPTPELTTDPRARKRELQVLMDMRADARRTRKAQKHRSKEIGALLDLKTHAPMLPIAGLPPVGGKGWTRSIAHLVAHMMFRRRERAKPLEGRVPASPEAGAARRRSSLEASVSAEDLCAVVDAACGEDEDGPDRMEM